MTITHGVPFPIDTGASANFGQLCWLSSTILLFYCGAGEGAVGADAMSHPFGAANAFNYWHVRAFRMQGLEMVEAGPIFAPHINWNAAASIARLDGTRAVIAYIDYVNVPREWGSADPPPAGYKQRSRDAGDGVARVLTVDPDTLAITRGDATVFSVATYDDGAHGAFDGSASGVLGDFGSAGSSVMVTALNSGSAVVGYNYGESPDNRNFSSQVDSGTWDILDNFWSSYRLCALSITGTTVTAGPEKVVETGATDPYLRKITSRGAGVRPYSWTGDGAAWQEPIRTSGSSGVFVYQRGHGHADGCAMPFTVSGSTVSLGTKTVFAPSTIKAEFNSFDGLTVSFNNGMGTHYNTKYGNRIAVSYPWKDGWNNGVGDASRQVTILDNGGEVVETFSVPQVASANLVKLMGVGDLFAAYGTGSGTLSTDTIRSFTGVAAEDTVSGAELKAAIPASRAPALLWDATVFTVSPSTTYPGSQSTFNGRYGAMSILVRWRPGVGAVGSGTNNDHYAVIVQGTGGILTLGIRDVRITAITDIDGRGALRATARSNPPRLPLSVV